MKLKVTRTTVWAAPIRDRPGGLAEKLEALAKARANLEVVIARRAPERPGRGVVFVTPLKTLPQQRAGKQVGFKRTRSLHSVRVEGTDRPGIGAKISRALADAGINLRGLSAAAIGKKFVCHIAVDTEKDASQAVKLLKKVK